MTRDEFAKQFIQGASSRGISRDEIVKTLPNALADFDAQNKQLEQTGNALTNLLGIDTNSIQQGQQQIAESNANPLLKGAATIQNVAGNSGDVIPLVTSSALRAAIPIPGLSTFIGGYGGQRVQQINKRGGMEALVPTPEENTQATKTGALYGGTDLLLSAIIPSLFQYGKAAVQAKTLNPLKISNVVEANKAAASKAVIKGDDILKAVKAGHYPVGTGEKVADLMDEVTQKFKGKTFTIPEAEAEMNAASVAYSKLGQVGKTAGAQLNSAIYGTIRNKIGEVAPEVASEIGKQAFMHGLPKNIQKTASLFAKLGLGAGGVSLSGILGRNQ